MKATGYVLLAAFGAASVAAAERASQSHDVDYRVLATSRMSTMERELNDYAAEGFVLIEAMGGETAFGGDELVAIMERDWSVEHAGIYEYLVLSTNRTSTMERELRDAARRGFVFVEQTVFETSFNGQEVVVIMERSPHNDAPVCEYELLATSRTSTMQDELDEYARKGFIARGLSVSETAFGGNEIVVVTERCVAP